MAIAQAQPRYCLVAVGAPPAVVLSVDFAPVHFMIRRQERKGFPVELLPGGQRPFGLLH